MNVNDQSRLDPTIWPALGVLPSAKKSRDPSGVLHTASSIAEPPPEDSFIPFERGRGGRGRSQRGGRDPSQMRDLARRMRAVTVGDEVLSGKEATSKLSPRAMTLSAAEGAAEGALLDTSAPPRGGRGYSARGGRGFSRYVPSSSKETAVGKDLRLGLGADGRIVKPLHVIENAHQDDIHGFLTISPEHFVSGSKDNTLKMWRTNGSLVQDLIPQIAQQSMHRGYKYWITSLARINETVWASGTRDGEINFWDGEGGELSAMRYAPSKSATEQYKCKDRNKCRINCITPKNDTEEGRFFYTGTPKFIQVWDSRRGIINSYKASDNDWVYCIEELENKDLLVVIGSDLEYWNMRSVAPIKSPLIRSEGGERRAFQRPHISAITRLEGDSNHLAAALFDGSVKVVDITAQRLLRRYEEHERRVWSIVNLTPELFASSADDRTIKVWDVRQEKAVKSFIAGPGRVSSLLRLSEHTFISGSCPDDVYASAEKASISFWDIRTL